MSIDEKLASLGIIVPIPPAPKGNYVSVVSVGTGTLLHLCGHLPRNVNDGSLIVGKVGRDLTVDDGYNSARLCAIQILGTLKQELGSLDRVARIVKVVGFVNCTDDFTQHPAVINGASDLLAQVFGEKGRHARSAVGSCSLPFGVATEVECVVEVSHK
jgi:enamine deaminase RidA (YjgF/YER057c/UK114 family)